MKRLFVSVLVMVSLSVAAGQPKVSHTIVLEMLTADGDLVFHAAGPLREGGSLPLEDLRIVPLESGAAAEVGTACLISDARVVANAMRATIQCTHLRPGAASAPHQVVRGVFEQRVSVPFNELGVSLPQEMPTYGPVVLGVFVSGEYFAPPLGVQRPMACSPGPIPTSSRGESSTCM